MNVVQGYVWRSGRAGHPTADYVKPSCYSDHWQSPKNIQLLNLHKPFTSAQAENLAKGATITVINNMLTVIMLVNIDKLLRNPQAPRSRCAQAPWRDILEG